MKTRFEIETKLKELKPFLSNRFHVNRIGLFGSFASGSQNINSDVDLLVEFSKPVGWEFFTLEKILEENLGIRVDLVTKNALKAEMKDSILNQVQYI